MYECILVTLASIHSSRCKLRMHIIVALFNLQFNATVCGALINQSVVRLVCLF